MTQDSVKGRGNGNALFRPAGHTKRGKIARAARDAHGATVFGRMLSNVFGFMMTAFRKDTFFAISMT